VFVELTRITESSVVLSPDKCTAFTFDFLALVLQAPMQVVRLRARGSDARTPAVLKAPGSALSVRLTRVAQRLRAFGSQVRLILSTSQRHHLAHDADEEIAANRTKQERRTEFLDVPLQSNVPVVAKDESGEGRVSKLAGQDQLQSVQQAYTQVSDQQVGPSSGYQPMRSVKIGGDRYAKPELR
jgi:hypothetical protein